MIDGTVFGNIARFFNHSCDPNMKWIKVWTGKEYPLVAFFTTGNIAAGTELTWNYDVAVTRRSHSGVKCLCGSEKCRGYL